MLLCMSEMDPQTDLNKPHVNQSPLYLSSQTQEREEDQHVLNLVGESLRLLGNTLVALSDLRCNLATPPPRHLHVVRPMSHYGSPVLLQGGMPHHTPIPVGHCVERFFHIYSQSF